MILLEGGLAETTDKLLIFETVLFWCNGNAMVTLINTNTTTPLTAPIGLDYVATSLRIAGIKTETVDLPLCPKPKETLNHYFASRNPELIGLSFRNADNCLWPNTEWFIPKLADIVKTLKRLTDAPIVIGGAGFSIFAERIVKHTGVEFGIRGDGETALVSLVREFNGKKRFENIPGLIWSTNGETLTNPPAWPRSLSLPTSRDAFKNLIYFKKSGQCGLETKRGCNQPCIYCADPLVKGKKIRTRNPSEVAQEAEQLLAQGIDVLHLCDSEFNIPRSHALDVCEEFIRRSIGKKIRWYAYVAAIPFDDELVKNMKKAGCIGIEFTGESASRKMLATYRQQHCKEHLASAVKLCRKYGIKIMIDLLLGGPGETLDSVLETINFLKHINPDCVGAVLGIRIYPGTEMVRIVAQQGALNRNPNIRHKYNGPVDFFKPTFYVSAKLGSDPSQLIKDLIGRKSR